MNYAFDSHLHILPLKYIPISSYITFLDKNKFEESYAVASSPQYIFKDILQNRKAVLNMISVMENDPLHILLLLEDDLCGRFHSEISHTPQQALIQKHGVQIGNTQYDRLVLTPLIMDFELPDLVPTVYYKRVAHHSLFEQVSDMLESIRRFRLLRNDSRIMLRPYIGINPHYRTTEEIEYILETYFGSRSRWSPYAEDAVHAWDAFKQKKPFIEIPRNVFAGIKLYPPMGFDPFPDDIEQRKKLSVLYSFCQKKEIPIVTHCDDQGFRTIPLEQSFIQTSPERWQQVLEQYPNLYLDIAHFGKQYYRGHRFKSSIPWQKKIIELLIKYPHVYSDVSFDGVQESLWKDIDGILAALSAPQREIVSRKLLFGTDWPLCLSKIESALQYWTQFSKAPISDTLKNALVSVNPMNFHFRQKNP